MTEIKFHTFCVETLLGRFHLQSLFAAILSLKISIPRELWLSIIPSIWLVSMDILINNNVPCVPSSCQKISIFIVSFKDIIQTFLLFSLFPLPPLSAPNIWCSTISGIFPENATVTFNVTNVAFCFKFEMFEVSYRFPSFESFSVCCWYNNNDSSDRNCAVPHPHH